MKEIKVIGIGASDGIAIAKAYKINDEKINITNEKIDNSEKEIVKLEEKIKISIAELDNIATVTDQKISKEKGDIFRAHQLFLKDPVLIDEIKNKIIDENINAAFATNAIINNNIQIFEAMENEYFKERAADLKDVGNRLLKHLLNIKTQDLATINEEVIIVAHDLTPSQTAQLDRKYVKGFICDIGGKTSHAAIMARSLEIPAVLGLKNITKTVKDNDELIINGNTGVVIVNGNEKEKLHWLEMQKQFSASKLELKKYINEITKTKDGFQVYLEANIGNDQDAKESLNYGAEGVGLFRTEFLYMENKNWPDEETQFQAYKNVLQTMDNKMVVIRTLDIGGDKILPYYKFESEMNPFLGYRAIRFCLDQVEIFKTQLRALLRASVYGKLAIMFPMIATIDEFLQAKKIVAECQNELNAENKKFSDNIEIGLMVEIPSTAVMADQFTKYADFVSIGTNDLVQYSMAVDRMSNKVEYLYQIYNPALLRLIKMTIDGAHQNKKWVGMCGEMAGDIFAVPLLLGLGLDYFSMSATSILKTRKIINNLNKSDAEKLVETALQLETNDQVRTLVETFLKEFKLI